MPQESLLPGTDAITRSTVEIALYHGNWLVRVKDRAGYARQRRFTDLDEAMGYFWDCARELRDAVRSALDGA
jgi:hypothetical protein